MIKISNWFGRSGNNIHQLVGARILANLKNTDVLYPYHPLLKECNLRKDDNKSISDCGDFFYRSRHDGLRNLTEQDVRNECLEIKNILNLEISSVINPTVIHIRNGDIFDKNPHANYIQPPLQYYITAIENENVNFEDVIVLSQNTTHMNPVVKRLQKLGCNIVSTSEKKSIFILTQAQTVISSLSSFSKYFYYMSENAKTLYIPDFSYIEGPALYASKYGSGMKDIKVNIANIPNYIKEGEWAASQEQLELMIEYDKKTTFGEPANV